MHSEKITRKADFILAKLKYLKENRPEDVERFRTDETKQMAILYALQVCIEAIVDIAILIGTKEYENKVVLVTGGAKLFFWKGKALPLLSAMSKKPLLTTFLQAKTLTKNKPF